MKKFMKKSAEKDLKYVNILGINVNSTSISSVLTWVENKISHNAKFYIVTPNPEHVLAAISNSRARNALNNADIAVPDGVGLKFASIFLYGKNLNIIHGRKLFMELVRLGNEKGWKIFLISGLDKEGEIVKSKLGDKYNKLKIETGIGPVMTPKAEPLSQTDRELESSLIAKINKFHPEILFVPFGNPKQEIWINKNLSRLSIGGAMVVGGTFRYIAGFSPLPPRWMEYLELEWLWRLITEPYRLKRIINAVIVFPLRVFWFKITQ